ncbi:MAG: DUF1580 domain-containing protein [Sedimentisphaerales bacterium]
MRTKNNSTKFVENAASQQQISLTPFKSFLTLSQAAEIIPRANGRRFTSSTVWRWCRKGIRGVYLEHVCIGRAILTSEAALYKFFEELAKAERQLTTDRIITNKCHDCNQTRQQATDTRHANT